MSPVEGRDGAPPDMAEKLAMRPSVDDGRPARRRLHTLRDQNGYRVEESEKHGKAVVPVLVSIRPMDERTWWRRADSLSAEVPWFELVRKEPEAPPRGTQWDDATSSGPGR